MAQESSQNTDSLFDAITKPTIAGGYTLENLFFFWCNPILKDAQQHTFEQEFHGKLDKEDQSSACFKRFSQIADLRTVFKPKIDNQNQISIMPLLRVACSAYRWEILGFSFSAVILVLLEYGSTYFMYNAMNSLKNPDKIPQNSKLEQTLILVVGLFLTEFSSATLKGFQSFGVFRISSRIRAGVVSLIFGKMQKKCSESEVVFKLPEIINLVQTDSWYFEDIVYHITKVVSIPVELTIGVCALYYLNDFAIFPAFSVFLLSFLLDWLVSWMEKAFKKNYLQKKDAFGNSLSELLDSIRYVKISALETFSVAKLLEKKLNLLKALRNLFLRVSISSCVDEMLPMLFSVVLNAFYLVYFGNISVEKAFTSVLILNTFKSTLQNIPYSLVYFIDLSLCASRISSYLYSAQVDQSYLEFQEANEELGVEISNASFYWQNQEDLDQQIIAKTKAFGDKLVQKSKTQNDKKFREESGSQAQELLKNNLTESLVSEKESSSNDDALLVIKNINLKIKRGSRVALYGGVGSGKSSLIAGILGEIQSTFGTKVKRDPQVALVPQQAWIISDTLKNNILLGRPYNESKFKEVIKASALEVDLDSFPNGEFTLIGNKGLNLSGGQKARISFARALYSDVDVFILDDPLATLDKNVATEVLERGIVEYLNSKTVLMATNSVTHLPYFDKILVIDKKQLVFEGSFFEFQSTPYFESASQSFIEENFENEEVEENDQKKPSTLADSLSVYLEESQKNHQINTTRRDITTSETERVTAIRDLLETEEKQQGEIKMSSLTTYMSMFGYFNLFLVLVSRFR